MDLLTLPITKLGNVGKYFWSQLTPVKTRAHYLDVSISCFTNTISLGDTSVHFGVCCNVRGETKRCAKNYIRLKESHTWYDGELAKVQIFLAEGRRERERERVYCIHVVQSTVYM